MTFLPSFFVYLTLDTRKQWVGGRTLTLTHRKSHKAATHRQMRGVRDENLIIHHTGVGKGGGGQLAANTLQLHFRKINPQQKGLDTTLTVRSSRTRSFHMHFYRFWSRFSTCIPTRANTRNPTPNTTVITMHL